MQREREKHLHKNVLLVLVEMLHYMMKSLSVMHSCALALKSIKGVPLICSEGSRIIWEIFISRL